MAKNTLRDLVWCEVVARRDDSEAFTKQDITAAVESSARTVHDVLQTAVEHGLLEKERERQKVDDPRGDRATQRQEVNVYRVAENHEPSDMATQNPVNGKNHDSTPTPDADKNQSTRADSAEAVESESGDGDTPTLDVNLPSGGTPNYAEFLPDVGDDRAGNLIDAGYSYEDLFNASQDDLTEVPGIGPKTAVKIKVAMVGAALNHSEGDITKDDLPDMETAAVADMFNLSEELADDLQTDIRHSQMFA
jgi:DNA uptake protein ComE-like DNA-binding protein